jgi:transcriptional regulator with XRE-family HTH domain
LPQAAYTRKQVKIKRHIHDLHLKPLLIKHRTVRRYADAAIDAYVLSIVRKTLRRHPQTIAIFYNPPPLRKRLGLTQMEFAERLGISRSAISLIEIGKNPLTEQNIKTISLTFGVNDAWLRTGEGEMLLLESTKREEELLKLFRQLTPPMQDAILEHVKNLTHLRQIPQPPAP